MGRMRTGGMMSGEHATRDGNLGFAYMNDGILNGMLRDAGLPHGLGLFRDGDSYHLALGTSSRHQDGLAFTSSRAGTMTTYEVQGDGRSVHMYVSDRLGRTNRWSDSKGNNSSWQRTFGSSGK